MKRKIYLETTHAYLISHKNIDTIDKLAPFCMNYPYEARHPKNGEVVEGLVVKNGKASIKNLIYKNRTWIDNDTNTPIKKKQVIMWKNGQICL